MKIIIRRAKQSDYGAVYKMLCELENEDLGRKIFQKKYNTNLRNKNIYYFVAAHNKQIVGFVSLHIQNVLHHVGPVGEIQEIFVDRTVRRQGIGKKLITVVRRMAKERGCQNLEVTSNMKRKNTHNFYERESLKKTHYKFVQKLR